ncbi:MAG: carbohydrate binding domain-containing protein [Firmicutes bacterium]|nr:carbohydrate binding domain-containing protein [Bacillota bacterium]
MNNIELKTKKKLFPTGDLWGIFFEDINHAADGGLYPEMVRNRSFEFCEIDNKDYTPLTAWSKRGGGEIKICSDEPMNGKNPHYLVIEGAGTAAVNEGFNTGLPYTAGEKYNFSFYAKSAAAAEIEIRFESKSGELYYSRTFAVTNRWTKYSGEFDADVTDSDGRVALQLNLGASAAIDMVSVMPAATFKNHGLRSDLAQMLADLKPKFMRFPGGGRVHDGGFDKNARNSLYRWTNTVGDVEERPARRNNWGYNQTAGLGYYEYFLFCEDIGAKPIPILSGAWNPHAHTGVPIDELGEWVDEALALIEFANGGADTKWGGLRAKMGHAEPFGLEYIGIGNEEVSGGFFERYPYFHNAIREKYPSIKIIGTSGPFADGYDFEVGWSEARRHGTDIVDEHYYMHPEWFIANIDRYRDYDRTDPKVFVGEYASWGNKYKNALTEACYMTELENNSDVVSLACYAPLFTNADYVNWKPDMIWFDNHRVYGTANYYVQKMFMTNQADYVIDTKFDSQLVNLPLSGNMINGRVGFSTCKMTAEFYDVTVNGGKPRGVYKTCRGEWSEDNGAYRQADGEAIAAELFLNNNCENDTVYSLKARKISGKEGFRIIFGARDNGDYYFWEIGGWNNDVSSVNKMIDGTSACITVGGSVSVETGREYKIDITVNANHFKCYLDGKLMHDFEEPRAEVRPLYYTAGVSGDEVVLKAANLRGDDYETQITLDRAAASVSVTEMTSDDLDAENSFDEPKKLVPAEREIKINGESFVYTFPKNSVTVLKIK